MHSYGKILRVCLHLADNESYITDQLASETVQGRFREPKE
jgi:hypothetical protein